MDVSLKSLYQNLTLTDQEDATIHMDEQQLEDMIVRTDKCLVLRLLTGKHYNIQAF